LHLLRLGIQLAFDIQGNKIAQAETSLTIWYTYDEMGSQIKLVDSNGRIKGQVKDAKGRTTGSVDINGSVDFGYDVNDRLESLKVSGEASTTFGYNGNGSRTRYKQANLVNTAFWYDDAGKLSSIETSTSGGTKLLDLAYQYIDESNIGTETAGGQSQTFGYDDADQLKSWVSITSVETTYAYDDAGNRTKAGDTVFGYATSTNQLTSMASGSATYTYGYDPSGNLNTVTDGIDTTTYTWTGDNRLESISSSSTSAVFTYDAEGKRTSKTINGVTTKFVYDGIKLIAEKDGSGTIAARYFYDDSGQLVSMRKDGNNYYFHLNHRGDVVKVTDGAEAVVASYSYDPWGNILSSTETVTDLQPFRYASYYLDSDLGAYYLINRYYDPVIGRFVSKDPASDPEEPDANQYGYCRNNPVMGIDSDGLYWDGNPNYHRLLSLWSQGEDVRQLQIEKSTRFFTGG